MRRFAEAYDVDRSLFADGQSLTLVVIESFLSTEQVDSPKPLVVSTFVDSFVTVAIFILFLNLRFCRQSERYPDRLDHFLSIKFDRPFRIVKLR